MQSKASLILAAMLHLAQRLPQTPCLFTIAIICLLWLCDILPLWLRQWAGHGADVLEFLGAWLLLDLSDIRLWHSVKLGLDHGDSYCHYCSVGAMCGSLLLLWRFLLMALPDLDELDEPPETPPSDGAPPLEWWAEAEA